MDDTNVGAEQRPFEHAAGFAPGELSGNVRLDRDEAEYEALFAEVIADGVITPEERARLDLAAASSGLDPRRLRELERALQSAYESRHSRRIVEPGAPAPAERSAVEALQSRVAYLEARVAELEQELEEARSPASFDVDFSDLRATPPAGHEDDPAELRRALRHDPRDPELLRRLHRACRHAGDLDGAFCAAHVLVYIGEADGDEAEVFRENLVQGLAKPTTSVSSEAWRRLLAHPDEEALVGEIFSVVAYAVLLGSVGALRQSRALVTLDPAGRHDPSTSTVQAVRCFAWAASILGMSPPPLYADPSSPVVVEMVPGLPPSSRLGKAALSGRTPRELAFAAGRHLAFYREERFVRTLVPRLGDLEDVLLSGLLIANPGLPLAGETRARVAPLSAAITPILKPPQIDRLRGAFLRFVDEGGRANLRRWADGADRTAARAGLLLANNLADADEMLRLERAPDAAALMDDLVAFTTSERYGELRAQLGVAVGAG